MFVVNLLNNYFFVVNLIVHRKCYLIVRRKLYLISRRINELSCDRRKHYIIVSKSSNLKWLT